MKIRSENVLVLKSDNNNNNSTLHIYAHTHTHTRIDIYLLHVQSDSIGFEIRFKQALAYF